MVNALLIFGGGLVLGSMIFAGLYRLFQGLLDEADALDDMIRGEKGDSESKHMRD